MNTLSQSLPMLDRIFLITAATGAFTVLLRAALLFAGSDLDGHDGDGLDGHDPGEGAEGFRFLSVFGLASFLMMFGLVGLALRHQSSAGAGLAILGGGLAGLVALWGLARLFHLGRHLQSSGTLLPQAAAGCTGVVYLGIPAGGTGRVTVRIGQRLREMDAMHCAGTALPTGTPVRVLRVERAIAIVQALSPMELS